MHQYYVSLQCALARIFSSDRLTENVCVPYVFSANLASRSLHASICRGPDSTTTVSRAALKRNHAVVGYSANHGLEFQVDKNVDERTGKPTPYRPASDTGHLEIARDVRVNAVAKAHKFTLMRELPKPRCNNGGAINFSPECLGCLGNA